MIYSNTRKLYLSGWLKENHIHEYEKALKLQKFLFLYEAFSKTAGEKSDFQSLKGYKKGPVFSQVWGDYTKEREAFNQASENSYHTNLSEINYERAKKCGFIVSVLTEKELSDLTHGFHIWKSKKERIMKGEYQVPLEEQDFSTDDVQMTRLLNDMFPIKMVESSTVVNIDNYYFVFPNNVVDCLTEEHYDILSLLSENEVLHNPVYVDIDTEGKLIID